MPFQVVIIGSTSNTGNRGGNLSVERRALLPWWRWKISDVLSVLETRWQKSREFFSFSTETRATLEAFLASRAIRLGWLSVLRSAFSLTFSMKRLLQVG